MSDQNPKEEPQVSYTEAEIEAFSHKLSDFMGTYTYGNQRGKRVQMSRLLDNLHEKVAPEATQELIEAAVKAHPAIFSIDGSDVIRHKALMLSNE